MLPAPPVVRPATAKDLGAVRALLERCELPLDGLDEQFGDGYVIAERDGEVIGIEGIERYGVDGLLRSAAVDPAVRGEGIGELLTRNRITWARAQGLRALYLLTTTAANWFPRFGFETISRTEAPDGIRASREFADACPASATFMRLPLNGKELQ